MYTKEIKVLRKLEFQARHDISYLATSQCWGEEKFNKEIKNNDQINCLVKVIQILENMETEKTLTNTTASQAKDNVKDIVFWGNGDTFKLISKASSKNEGWMKSTKAMEIQGVGCVIQVTTQQDKNVAETICFVPSVKIQEKFNDESESAILERKIVSLTEPTKIYNS